MKVCCLFIFFLGGGGICGKPLPDYDVENFGTSVEGVVNFGSLVRNIKI